MFRQTVPDTVATQTDRYLDTQRDTERNREPDIHTDNVRHPQ